MCFSGVRFTKRGGLAKNDTGRRLASEYDAWSMHPPKYDTNNSK
jgi:hypothetical protein